MITQILSSQNVVRFAAESKAEPGSDPAVLCLDNDPFSGQAVGRLLQENGFAPLVVNTLGAALEALTESSPPVIMTEIHISPHHPMQVLQALRVQSPGSVILIRSAHEERRKGTDRRLGVAFDYVHKNAPPEQLLGHLRRSIEFSQLKRTADLREQAGPATKTRSQLEWLIWKQHTRLRHEYQVGLNALQTVRRSLTHGLGLGSLLTHLDLLALQQKRVELPPSLAKSLERVQSSAAFVSAWLRQLEKLSANMEREYPAEVQNGSDLRELLLETCDELGPKFSLGNHRLIVEDFSWSDLALRSSRPALRLAFRELLLNALQFSPRESTIHCTGFRTRNGVSLLVLNDVWDMGDGYSGIPRGYENTVLEPFFRMTNVHTEGYLDEDFGLGLGLGLGLAAVRDALAQCESCVHLYEVKDYVTGEKVRRRVAAEVIIPAAYPDDA